MNEENLSEAQYEEYSEALAHAEQDRQRDEFRTPNYPKKEISQKELLKENNHKFK